jgi:TQXA domain-containing protein
LSTGDKIRNEIQLLISNNIYNIIWGEYKGTSVFFNDDYSLNYNCGCVFYLYYFDLMRYDDDDEEKAIKEIIDSYVNAIPVTIYSSEEDQTNYIYNVIEAFEKENAGEDSTAIENLANSYNINTTEGFDKLLFKYALLYKLDYCMGTYQKIAPDIRNNIKTIEVAYNKISYNDMVAFSLHRSNTSVGSEIDENLYNKILACASCYSGAWMQKIREEYDDSVSMSDIKDILRRAVQYAIWSYVEGGNVKFVDSSYDNEKLQELVVWIKANTETYSEYWTLYRADDLIVSTMRKDNEPTYYIGFQDNTTRVKTDGENPLSAFAFYVTDPTTYDVGAYKYDEVDGKYTYNEKIENKNTQIAYCFNKSRSTPGNYADGTYNPDDKSISEGRNIYQKLENVSADEFWNNSGKCVEADKLRTMVIYIGLNGYPNDLSGLNKDNIISDNSFRALTQFAIWYYTDGYDLTKTGDYDRLTDAEKTIYKKLIAEPTNSNIINAVEGIVDLYISNGTNVTGQETREFQNLLAVRTLEPDEKSKIEIDDEISPGLIVKKIVANKTGDTTSYEFTISIIDNNGEIISDLSSLNVYYYDKDSSDKRQESLEFNGNKAIFLLKDGQSMEIVKGQLPSGYKYAIEENIPEGLSLGTDFDIKITTTVDGEIDSSVSKLNSPRSTTRSTLDAKDNITVTYTNTYKETEVPVPTGIRVDVLPYILIMMIAIAGFVGLTVRRRITKGR